MCLKINIFHFHFFTYRGHSDGLHISNSCGAAKHPHISREGGFEAGLALLPLKGLDQSSFLPTDVRPGASVHEHVEVIARATGVFADQTRFVCLKYKIWEFFNLGFFFWQRGIQYFSILVFTMSSWYLLRIVSPQGAAFLRHWMGKLSYFKTFFTNATSAQMHSFRVMMPEK